MWTFLYVAGSGCAPLDQFVQGWGMRLPKTPSYLDCEKSNERYACPGEAGVVKQVDM